MCSTIRIDILVWIVVDDGMALKNDRRRIDAKWHDQKAESGQGKRQTNQRNGSRAEGRPIRKTKRGPTRKSTATRGSSPPRTCPFPDVAGSSATT